MPGSDRVTAEAAFGAMLLQKDTREAIASAEQRDCAARGASNCSPEALPLQQCIEDIDMGSGLARGMLLWLLGVPLSVIILIALFTSYI